MKRYILLFFVLVLPFGVVQAQKSFELATGDLLFQVNGSNSYTDAIKGVTSGIEGLEFSHVGVALVDSSGVYVLEAIPYGVVRTPLKTFFTKSQKHEGNPMVVVGRVKHRYEKYIPDAIAKIETLLGKRYDFTFTPNDNNYYCSEIIYVSYLDKSGKPIFKAAPMTFKDKKTGETSPLWVKHFKMHKQPIPEGVEGTNPGDMSRSKAIKIVHRYF